MSNKLILEQYIDLQKSCLSDTERKYVIDMIYKYKDAFSLRVYITTSPKLEVEIYVTDTSLFYTQYHIKERDKATLDKEMKILCF